MTEKCFRVAVTGDTGYDIFTEYVPGYESSNRRVRSPDAAYDLEVPAAAAYVAKALRVLLDCDSSRHIRVEHLIPREASEGSAHNVGFTTATKLLVELERFENKDGTAALRVRQSRPIVDKVVECARPDVFNSLVADEPGRRVDPTSIDLLVIHDGNGIWRSYPASPAASRRNHACHSAMDLVEQVISVPQSSSSERPRVLVNLTQDLPDVEPFGQDGERRFAPSLTFWNKLWEYRDRVCIICSITTLRKEGALISGRQSWEQIIEDLAVDLALFDKLRVLSQFRHLIVRLDLVGAAHVLTNGRSRSIDVVFAPRAKAGVYRDRAEEGSMEGENVLLAASLARAFAAHPSLEPDRMTFVDAMKAAVHANMRTFDLGYIDTALHRRPRVAKSEHGTPGDQFIRDLYDGRPEPSAKSILRDGYDELRLSRPDQVLGHLTVPVEVIDPTPRSGPTQRPSWEILRNALSPAPLGRPLATDERELANLSRINIGAAIVTFGHERVLNRRLSGSGEVERVLRRPICVVAAEEPRDYITLPRGQRPALPNPGGSPFAQMHVLPVGAIYLPVMGFGHLTVVERREIESLRSIRNLLKDYLEQGRSDLARIPPISIAVFGPPGSGKSFAVREIARDINAALSDNNRERGFEAIEYNMAQFRTVDELGEAITRATVINNEGKTPLVFFDEFDCTYQRQPLGWLKNFLSPMQDGTFYAARQTIKMAKAVFVFAGGTHETFESFNATMDKEAPRDAAQVEEFQRRARMFAEQKGPDFISRLRGHVDILPINAGEGEIKPIIRRAMILRSLMKRRGLIFKVGDENVAHIDPDILYALLTVDQYRHGTRSLEAILHMCSPIDGKIEKASLPPRAQLNMHVDAEGFFIRVVRGRCRPPLPPEPEGVWSQAAPSSLQSPDLCLSDPSNASTEAAQSARTDHSTYVWNKGSFGAERDPDPGPLASSEREESNAGDDEFELDEPESSDPPTSHA